MSLKTSKHLGLGSFIKTNHFENLHPKVLNRNHDSQLYLLSISELDMQQPMRRSALRSLSLSLIYMFLRSIGM